MHPTLFAAALRARAIFMRLLPAPLMVVSGALLADHPVQEDAYFEPLPVVLTAARLPQALQDAPGAMTVLDRSLIEATGYRDLPRLLRFVPGMHVGYERSHASWISYHGLGLRFPGEMQILVDGMASYVPSNFGTIAWSQLPIFLDEIERIEVVRGASGNNFGSSALLGTINLITRSGAESPGAHVELIAGDPGIRDLTAGWAGGAEHWSLRFTAGDRNDDGFRGLMDDHRLQQFSLRADAQPTADDHVMIRIGSTRQTAQRGYPDSPFDSNAPRTARDRSHQFQAQWRRTTAPDREWVVNFQYHALDNNDAWFADAGPAFALIPLSRDREVQRTAIEVQRRDRWSDSVRGVWGVEATHHETRAPMSYFGRDVIRERNYRVFGNIEWQARAPLTGNLGLAAEKHVDDGWRLSPRLYANYRLADTDTLRFGVSRAWRAPITFERFGDIRVFDPATGVLVARPYVRNPDLRPTRADTVELGYLKQFGGGRHLLDLRIFEERLRNLLVRRPITLSPAPALQALIPSTQAENLDQTLVLHGAELQLVARPWRDGEVRLAWSLIENDAPDAEIGSAIAPYTAHLSWQQHWPGQWTSFVGVTRVAAVASGDSFVDSGRYVVDAFTTIDLSLSRRFSLGGHDARFTLSALNVGPRHQEVADPAIQRVRGDEPANRVSRQVYAGLEVRF